MQLCIAYCLAYSVSLIIYICYVYIVHTEPTKKKINEWKSCWYGWNYVLMHIMYLYNQQTFPFFLVSYMSAIIGLRCNDTCALSIITFFLAINLSILIRCIGGGNMALIVYIFYIWDRDCVLYYIWRYRGMMIVGTPWRLSWFMFDNFDVYNIDPSVLLWYSISKGLLITFM